MRQEIPGLENLTVANLREWVADLGKCGIRDPNVVQLGLAQGIIGNTLGREFWAKECTSFGNKQPFFAKKSDVRVLHLAHALWCLRESRGFPEFLKKNDKNDFESTYFEAVAAYMFQKQSRDIELVIPSQVRGADFDIKVEGFCAHETLCVEVKARRSIFQTAPMALNFLKKLRTQLPQDEKGAVFCKIAIDEGAIGQEEIISVTRRFLSDTARISFIVYCWDMASIDNAIALAYLAIDRNGEMGPLFGSSGQPVTPRFMIDLGLLNSTNTN